MRCYACNEVLKPDCRPEEVTVLVNGEPNYDVGFDDHYQFDNALWIGLHGGYGMFVDNMDVSWPINGMDRFDDQGVEDPTWTPKFAVKRTLRGADQECVICHDCAHEACEKLPWVKRLIDPWSSHAHHYKWIEEHPEHWGWDYSRCERDYGPTDPTRRPPEHEVPPAPWNSPTPEE